MSGPFRRGGVYNIAIEHMSQKGVSPFIAGGHHMFSMWLKPPEEICIWFLKDGILAMQTRSIM